MSVYANGIVNEGQDNNESVPSKLNGFHAETPATDVTLDITDKDEKRESWGNKLEFLLATIGFAVGLGNVWRFPYLCQKNGGGAFLIPYFLSLFLLGIPLFVIELGMGQRLRGGSIGVWNQVSPYLGGIGVTSMVASAFICIYYNMIVGWCFYYFFISFQDPLPYQDCPTNDHGNKTLKECEIAGATSYYWYRKALDLSPSISETGKLQWHLVLVLLLAWLVVFLCTMKGVKSTGKAVYVTALFPYLVLIIFFFRAVTLEGAGDGLKRMFTPKFETLGKPSVWLEAATQIFFSLSLSFGGLIAMASFNPVKNNCKKDAIMVSLINCGTSVFASIVVFSVLGFKATQARNECLDEVAKNATTNLTCKSLDDYLSDVAQGTGLSFIAFTEAITKMPAPQLWSVLFFLMLITLGMGSMFGNVAGIVTPLRDLGVKMKMEFLYAITCSVLFLIGLLLCQNSGEYWLQLFDSYSLNLALLWIALFHLIGMNFVYGTERFRDDVEYMTGVRPGMYWVIMWRFLGPVLGIILFIAGLVDMGREGIGYSVWDMNKAESSRIGFPPWGEAMVVIFVCLALIWVPLVAAVRFFGFFEYQGKTLDPNFEKTASRLELANGKEEKSAFDSTDGDLDSKL